ncbi:hypothetical protein AVEN_224658-1 [Araneus ventricosus]|uniref:Uncharacterized protein n=1 Tax=Araneus ventricosus TaxID=182803 RepID=A0A4Y2M9E8_ARAVE|nr:hypothetical protein AVEN_224658-1 [Araneus ventricosus]
MRKSRKARAGENAAQINAISSGEKAAFLPRHIAHCVNFGPIGGGNLSAALVSLSLMDEPPLETVDWRREPASYILSPTKQHLLKNKRIQHTNFQTEGVRLLNGFFQVSFECFLCPNSLLICLHPGGVWDVRTTAKQKRTDSE